MKYLLIGLLLCTFGCGNYPDFSKDSIIISAELYRDNTRVAYTISTQNKGVTDQGIFVAPIAFASIGDTVGYFEGKIQVVKKGSYETNK